MQEGKKETKNWGGQRALGTLCEARRPHMLVMVTSIQRFIVRARPHQASPSPDFPIGEGGSAVGSSAKSELSPRAETKGAAMCSMFCCGAVRVGQPALC